MSSTFVINDKEKPSLNAIPCKSEKIQHVIALAQKAAFNNSPILITGEPGTGKKFIAEAIHHAGSSREFVAFNCKNVDEEVLEHQFYSCFSNGCTLFLENIEALTTYLQSKLLYLIEKFELANTKDINQKKIQLHIITSAGTGIKKLIHHATFSQLLYRRLSNTHITLPPLRERKEDIPALANGFLKYFSSKTGRFNLSLSANALKVLKNYMWKDNIKELKNVMERAVILEEKDIISTDSLPFEIKTDIINSVSLYDLDFVNKNDIQKVLKYTHGNKKETARLLNIGLNMLSKKMEEYLITG